MAFLVVHADEVHQCHMEKKWMKQVEMVRKEQLWGDVGEEVRERSREWRCGYCIKRGMAHEWPPADCKAHSCSQCREHKIPCMVEGERSKKWKE